MLPTTTLLLTLLSASSALAQAVPEGIAPDAPPPAGCETSVPRPFTLGIKNLFRKRETAQEAAQTLLLVTLSDSILHDPTNRTGSIVANYQFQFDGPPQAGAIYTGGFSVCENGSLALGESTRWWRCMSGEFGNLYDRWIGEQCSEVRIVAQFEGGDGEVTRTESEVVSSTTMETVTETESVNATMTESESEGSESTATESSATGAPEESATGDVSGAPEESAAESTTGSPEAPPAATGGSSPKALSQAMFGIVVGIVGAVWLL
ncbi:hypothetical protein M011DRAFT_471307 [Sporormia fimetaria CBS 119925]|uniref:Cell wall mannoprotein PIR1-like C-terminal domain-containing protein n=1 Tax=Sporormia fimetaria CBS 119925 TaxID=1340428 RepID=A0A6A6V0V0_9PLEO|nr:hypothetical protein M011DRAFT_471307 [Sporormia fimetaria CBS 119925]